MLRSTRRKPLFLFEKSTTDPAAVNVIDARTGQQVAAVPFYGTVHSVLLILNKVLKP